MPINLLKTPPQELLAVPYDELREAVQAIRVWTSRHAEVLDYICRHQVTRLLVRRGGEDDLAALIDHLLRLVPHGRKPEVDALGVPWTSIWSAYAALLDSRLAVLATQDPQKLLSRMHVSRILNVVRASPGVQQAELGSRLRLGKANLTRLLDLLEANELIERRPIGRTNQIYLGVKATSVDAAIEPKTNRFVGNESILSPSERMMLIHRELTERKLA